MVLSSLLSVRRAEEKASSGLELSQHTTAATGTERKAYLQPIIVNKSLK